MAQIHTLHGPLDETELIKTTGVVDTDTEHTTWVEYGEVKERKGYGW